MKKFLINIICFAAVVAVADLAVFKVLRLLEHTAKGGDTEAAIYINEKCEDDILILGSSRARHHYDPDIIGEELGGSCYNFGIDGYGIILMYGRLQNVLKRHKPKMIIYDIYGMFDLQAGDNHRFLPYLRRALQNDDIVCDIDATEKYKLLSHSYRFNGSIHNVLVDNVRPIARLTKGYWPMDKNMQVIPDIERTPKSYSKEYYDEKKVEYFKKFVALCKENDIQLVVAVSPSFRGVVDDEYKPAEDICEKNNIPFINLKDDEELACNSDYFYDSGHMNRTGATICSKKISILIKTIIS